MAVRIVRGLYISTKEPIAIAPQAKEANLETSKPKPLHTSLALQQSLETLALRKNLSSLTPNELRENIKLETDDEKDQRNEKVLCAKEFVKQMVAELSRLDDLYSEAFPESSKVKWTTLETEALLIREQLTHKAESNKNSKLEKRLKDLEDLIPLRKKELPLIKGTQTTSEKFLKVLEYVAKKHNAEEIMKDDEIVAFTAYYATRKGGFLKSFPADFITKEQEGRLAALIKHFTLDLAKKPDKKNLKTARDIETFDGWRLTATEAGLEKLFRDFSVLDLLKSKNVFGELFEGEDPVIRDWLMAAGPKWNGEGSLETTKKACAWFLKFGVRIIKDDKTFDAEKTQGLSWTTELDNHGLRKMVELSKHTPNIIEVIKLGAESLGLPNPIGKQIHESEIKRGGMWTEVDPDTKEMLIDKVSNTLLEELKKTNPALFDESGNLVSEEVKKYENWYTIYDEVATDALRKAKARTNKKMTAADALKRVRPYSFGLGRHQIKPNHITYDGLWKEEGIKHYRQAVALDGICYATHEGKTIGEIKLQDDPPVYILKPEEFKVWYESTIEGTYTGFAKYLADIGLSGGLNQVSEGDLSKTAYLLFGLTDNETHDLPRVDAGKRFHFKHLVLDLFQRQENKPLVIQLQPIEEYKHKDAEQIASEIKFWKLVFESLDRPEGKIKALMATTKAFLENVIEGSKREKALKATLEAYERVLKIKKGTYKNIPDKELFSATLTQEMLPETVKDAAKRIKMNGPVFSDPEILALVAKKLELEFKYCG